MTESIPFSTQVVLWTGQYLRVLLDPNEKHTDEEVERVTRIAFIAARTTVTLMNALEESLKHKLS